MAAFLAVALSGLAPDASAYSFSMPQVADVGEARGITPTPRGDVWIIDMADAEDKYAVKRVSRDGRVTKFRLPGAVPGRSKYTAITYGPDGNIWVAGRYAPYKKRTTFYRIRPNGDAKRFVSPTSMRAYAMTPGPDGRIWFIDQKFGPSQVASLGLRGGVRHMGPKTEAPLEALAQAPDGSMWMEGLEVLLHFVGTRYRSEMQVEKNSAGSITPLPDGRLLIPGDNRFQLIGPGGIEYVPTGDRRALDGFVAGNGQIGFTAGAFGSDALGHYVSESRIGLVSSSGEVSYVDAYKDGVSWVPNFVDSTDVSIAPGLKNAAVDVRGNLWAGMTNRLPAGIVKFIPSEPTVPTRGEMSILRKRRSGTLVNVQVGCTGLPNQFCEGVVRVRLSGSRRRDERIPVSISTATRTTVAVELKKGERFAGSTLLRR